MTTRTPKLVEAFDEPIWNSGDLKAASELPTSDFAFRGSLGAEFHRVPAFTGYVRSVREPLEGYRCDILECVSEGDRAFAKMRFGGRHVGMFRGWRRASPFTGSAPRFSDSRVPRLQNYGSWVIL